MDGGCGVTNRLYRLSVGKLQLKQQYNNICWMAGGDLIHCNPKVIRPKSDFYEKR